MRMVLIGVPRWHTPFFLDPYLEMPDVSIVGVGDPDLSRTEPAAAKAGCKAFTEYREMCAALQPGFAFALARHSDTAALARFLIGERIPFAMEKPCAINPAEATDIAVCAEAAGVFAAVPYVIRYSPLVETILSTNEPVQHAMFKFIGGHGRAVSPATGRVGDRPQHVGRRSAAQSRRPLHGLCRVLLRGAGLTVTGAMISNRNAHLTIEDHAVVLMQGGGASCMVEIGYLYPAPNSVFDPCLSG